MEDGRILLLPSLFHFQFVWNRHGSSVLRAIAPGSRSWSVRNAEISNSQMEAAASWGNSTSFTHISKYSNSSGWSKMVPPACPPSVSDGSTAAAAAAAAGWATLVLHVPAIGRLPSPRLTLSLWLQPCKRCSCRWKSSFFLTHNLFICWLHEALCGLKRWNYPPRDK